LTIVTKVLAVSALAAVVVGARVYVGTHGLPFGAAPSQLLEPGASVPHMDHSPRHGGLVLMKGDTHLEVVLNPDGSCQAYFTDAVRMELPASYASEVTLGLASRQHQPQEILLKIAPTGTSWVGRLPLVDDPDAIVRVAYVARGEAPYWIDVPLAAWRNVDTPIASIRR
jgi:hypothetical protein